MSTAPVPCTICDERCSVQCTCCDVEVLHVVKTAIRLQYDTSAVVSARAHGFYTVPYSYEFFLQVDALQTVSSRQNKECLTERIDNGTLAVLSARAHLIDVIFGDYSLVTRQSQANSEQAILRKTLASVLQMTVSTNCAGSR